MALPLKLSWDMAQTTWATLLNPVVQNPLINGRQINGISLVIGDNTINHGLGRKPQGYLIVGTRGAATQVYSVVSQLPALTLILNSSAIAEVDVYVY